MKKLYEFYWDAGRMGSVQGLFVEDEEVVEKAIGENVYFGEILGKHSEVEGTLEEQDLKVLSEDQDKIEWLVELMGSYTVSGYNPIERIDFDEEDEGEE